MSKRTVPARGKKFSAEIKEKVLSRVAVSKARQVNERGRNEYMRKAIGLA